jgi:hypothetical protein
MICAPDRGQHGQAARAIAEAAISAQTLCPFHPIIEAASPRLCVEFFSPSCDVGHCALLVSRAPILTRRGA